MNFTFCGKTITPEILREEKWLRYLFTTKENQVNVERLQSVNELSSNQTLLYVEKTLNSMRFSKTKKEKYKKCVIRALQWAEVAKAGTYVDRKKWEDKGYVLDIHNEASAEIYLNESNDDLWMTKIVYTLIKTHGLLGQYLRGEVDLMQNEMLVELLTKRLISREHLYDMLYDLNMSIILAVSPELWRKIENDIVRLIDFVCNGKIFIKENSLTRLKKIFPAFLSTTELTSDEEKIYQNIFPYQDLWYPHAALGTFSKTEINTIFSIIEKVDRRQIKHISFYNMSKNLAYDYEGKRKENIYKKRIIELCLREYAESIEDKKSKEHVNIVTEVKGDTLFFDVKFTPVCESLINFCVEAERSGFMDYQKNISTIFDLFGFRRDIFDRLNNEDKYLKTMNDAKNSTKLQLLDHVYGTKIVDVGSGGGVLLDMLEERFPDKEIIGTDISANVIETLNQKIEEENHHYSVKKHNFVEGPLDEKVDTIIFSSILHEVYSYTEFEGEKFNINSVKQAIKNAYKSLNDGGVILIRDGVLTSSIGCVSVKFKDDEGISFVKNFLKDFKGLKDFQDADGGWSRFSFKKDTLTADINFVREALYTYTWGTESYGQEVLEQFGYFTMEDYVYFLESLGLNINTANSLTEKGYPDNLNDKVKLIGFSWDDIPSTCFIVAKK